MDLLKANEIWNEQNIFLRIKETFYIEEIDFLEESFLLNVDATNKSECLKYNEIISFSNKSELRLILLDSESNHRGRGCICGCDSIVVDIKKELSLDLTGWNIAHEFGHLFGQFDIKNRYNLMCDQLKVIKPSFLNKKQIYSLTRNTFISSSVKIYN
ncbi:hypothetical protein KAI04_00035 [Candidatus Pacearchaeota archaeon]|nr:hypothetical protein [Candidatus Pacearchaeota archaeon]